MNRAADRALTMVELTVCLGILGVTLGAVVSIFFAGSRWALRAQEQTEAARVAQAVFDLAERGVPTDDWGRRTDGGVSDGEIDNLSPHAAGILSGPLPLVWRARISPLDRAQTGLDGLHCLEVIVSFDEDSSGSWSPTEREVGRYYAVLADR